MTCLCGLFTHTDELFITVKCQKARWPIDCYDAVIIAVIYELSSQQDDKNKVAIDQVLDIDKEKTPQTYHNYFYTP